MAKQFQVTQDIIALGDFKARTAEILRQLRQEQRPIVLTQHGRPAAVVMTPEEFDFLQGSHRFLAAVQEGLEDSEAGRVLSDEELTIELEREFGSE